MKSMDTPVLGHFQRIYAPCGIKAWWLSLLTSLASGEKHSWVSSTPDKHLSNIRLLTISSSLSSRRSCKLNFDAGTERAISISLLSLDEATTPKLAMDLCLRVSMILVQVDVWRITKKADEVNPLSLSPCDPTSDGSKASTFISSNSFESDINIKSITIQTTPSLIRRRSYQSGTPG